MVDSFSSVERSAIMRAVKGKDTTPEMVVRRLTHRLGFRYRLHDDALPGKPDLVFPARKKVIFVHGCFWHWHTCKRGRRMPKSRTEYWTQKLGRNVERDRRHRRALRRAGWDVLVIWECQTRNPAKLQSKIQEFLTS